MVLQGVSYGEAPNTVPPITSLGGTAIGSYQVGLWGVISLLVNAVIEPVSAFHKSRVGRRYGEVIEVLFQNLDLRFR